MMEIFLLFIYADDMLSADSDFGSDAAGNILTLRVISAAEHYGEGRLVPS